MARPVRIEYPNALYHVMSRGNAGANIYHDDNDRQFFLDLLNELTNRFGIICYAYCLMNNHYHLLLETPKANLSFVMRALNGRYTQFSNRKRSSKGHLFQGRYKSILVQKDSYLLELSRYIVLNPIRANLCEFPEEYIWSSYRDTVGLQNKLPSLATDNLLVFFHSGNRKKSIIAYRKFVLQGKGVSLSANVLQQAYLGDKLFIERVQSFITTDQKASLDVTKISKIEPKLAINLIVNGISDRNQAMKAIYDTGHYTTSDIGLFYGVHNSTVSRGIKKLIDIAECSD